MTRPSPIRGGIVSLSVNGEVLDVAEDVEYYLGGEEREAAVGPTGPSGYISKEGVPYIQASIRDHDQFDVERHRLINGATVVLELRNGKTIALREAYGAGQWTQQGVEGTISARWEGLSAGEV